MLSDEQLNQYLDVKNSGKSTGRISLRLNQKEFDLLNEYKNKTGMSISEIVRRSVFKNIM